MDTGRLRRLLAGLRDEAATWHADLRRGGGRWATERRLRDHAGTLELSEDFEHVWRLLDGLSGDLGQVWRLLDGHEERIARIERQVRTATVMAWIEQAILATEPLVSVVVSSRDRAGFLPRAIGSVLAQTYANWELIVADDGSTDGTPEVVAEVGDRRVRHLPGQQGGAARARNRGLDAANGELIAYLDDDNRMHPNWLKSVVWAFEQRPDAEILYGGIVVDDTARLHNEGGAEMPSAWLESFDAASIADRNIADTSAIAHRAGLAEARFDETLTTMGDWDLIARLSVEREPLMLPVIACFYFTDAHDRLSDLQREQARDARRVSERARIARSEA